MPTINYSATGQTSYQIDPSSAVPGQLVNADPKDIYAYPCAAAGAIGNVPQVPGANATMLAGLLVELDATNSTTLILPNEAGASIGKLLGASVYRAVMSPGGYNPGDMVPVVRRGQIWVYFQGGTFKPLDAVNVWHPSTNGSSNSQYSGYATASATSSTVGAEIAAVPNAKFLRLSADGTMALIELNNP